MAGIITRSQSGSSPAKKVSFLERLRQEQAASSLKKAPKVTKKTPTKVSKPSGPVLGGETPRRPAKKPLPSARVLKRMEREVAALRRTFDSLDIPMNDAPLPSVLVWEQTGTKYRMPLHGANPALRRIKLPKFLIKNVPGQRTTVETVVESIERDDTPIEQEEEDNTSRLFSLPGELRNQIYSFVFEDAAPTHQARNLLDPPEIFPEVAITRVCRQLYNETKLLHKEPSTRVWTARDWYVSSSRGTQNFETLLRNGDICKKLRTLPAQLRISNVTLHLRTPASPILEWVEYRNFFQSGEPFVATRAKYRHQLTANEKNRYAVALQQTFRLGTALEWAKLQKPWPNAGFDLDQVEGLVRAAFW